MSGDLDLAGLQSLLERAAGPGARAAARASMQAGAQAADEQFRSAVAPERVAVSSDDAHATVTARPSGDEQPPPADPSAAADAAAQAAAAAGVAALGG